MKKILISLLFLSAVNVTLCFERTYPSQPGCPIVNGKSSYQSNYTNQCYLECYYHGDDGKEGFQCWYAYTTSNIFQKVVTQSAAQCPRTIS
jgi:hypothetical protein